MTKTRKNPIESSPPESPPTTFPAVSETKKYKKVSKRSTREPGGRFADTRPTLSSIAPVPYQRSFARRPVVVVGPARLTACKKVRENSPDLKNAVPPQVLRPATVLAVASCPIRREARPTPAALRSHPPPKISSLRRHHIRLGRNYLKGLAHLTQNVSEPRQVSHRLAKEAELGNGRESSTVHSPLRQNHYGLSPAQTSESTAHAITAKRARE